MLPKEIVDILEKYQFDNQNYLIEINKSINAITFNLQSILNNLSNTLCKISNGEIMADDEDILWQEIKTLRNFIRNIDSINIKPKSEEVINDIDDQNPPMADIYSVVVLKHTLKCSSNHQTNDVEIQLPVVDYAGNIKSHKLKASYCFTCKRFTVLKNEFDKNKDVVVCKVIDETNTYPISLSNNYSEFEQRKSLLAQYGYNVQTKKNLSDIQRQRILTLLIETNIMTQRQLLDHISILIERGSKIESWKWATDKWVKDKAFIDEYKKNTLPQYLIKDVILKYHQPKFPEVQIANKK